MAAIVLSYSPKRANTRSQKIHLGKDTQYEVNANFIPLFKLNNFSHANIVHKM